VCQYTRAVIIRASDRVDFRIFQKVLDQIRASTRVGSATDRSQAGALFVPGARHSARVSRRNIRSVPFTSQLLLLFGAAMRRPPLLLDVLASLFERDRARAPSAALRDALSVSRTPARIRIRGLSETERAEASSLLARRLGPRFPFRSSSRSPALNRVSE